MADFNVTLRVELPEALLTALLAFAAPFARGQVGGQPLGSVAGMVSPPDGPVGDNSVAEEKVAILSAAAREVEAPKTANRKARQIVDSAERRSLVAKLNAAKASPDAVVWTAERKAAVEPLLREGLTREEMFERLNAMAGPAICSVAAVATRVNEMKRAGKLPAEINLLRKRGRNMAVAARADAGEDDDGAAALVAAQSAKVEVAPAVLGAELREAMARKFPVAQDVAPQPPAPLPAAEESLLAQKLREALVEKRAKETPPSPSPPAAREKPRPIEATMEEIRQWAGQRGLAPHNAPVDLDAINRKRAQLGISEFVLKAKFARRAA